MPLLVHLGLLLLFAFDIPKVEIDHYVEQTNRDKKSTVIVCTAEKNDW